MVPARIETERLLLRRFVRRDVDDLTAAVVRSLPELGEWLPWAHAGYGREDAAGYIRDSLGAWREGRAYDYAIRPLHQHDRHLGNISIWPLSRVGRTGEIGYWVVTGETSQGIATEATAALLEVGFDGLGLHKLTLRIGVGNRGSERVAEKLGFTKEGVLREELQVRGRWIDHTLFSLLEHEQMPAPARRLQGG